MTTLTFDTLEATPESQERLVTRGHFDARMEAMEHRITIQLGAFLAAAVGILIAVLRLP